MLNFLRDFFAVLQVAQTVNQHKLATDPAYRAEILEKLGGRARSKAVSNDNRQDDLKKAA
ncbi:MAG: hypothetical protein ACREDZ_12100 [Kiloniellales bacterium]